MRLVSLGVLFFRLLSYRLWRDRFNHSFFQSLLPLSWVPLILGLFLPFLQVSFTPVVGPSCSRSLFTPDIGLSYVMSLFTFIIDLFYPFIRSFFLGIAEFFEAAGPRAGLFYPSSKSLLI